MSVDLKKIEAELAQVGGALEWACDAGVGVSVPAGTTDDDFGRLHEAIIHAVWINLEGACVTDAALAKLEEASVLESIRVAHTAVSAVALKRLLCMAPMLCEVVLSGDQLSQCELASLQAGAPGVRFQIVD